MSNQLTSTKKPSDFLSLLQDQRTDSQLAKILPPNLSVERFKRIVRTAWLRSNDLQKLDPTSIMLSVMSLATLGLEPDGRMAYLIPFKGKAVGMPGYMGYIARATENGVSAIAFDVVCLNDHYTPPTRTENGITFSHTVDLRKPRGEMFAVFCSWKYKGENFCIQMPKVEIDRIRAGSPGKDQDPWRIHYNEMAKKTVIRRAQKQWPLDVKMAAAIASGAIIESPVSGPIDIESEVEAIADEPPAPAAPETPKQESAREFVIRTLTAAGVPWDGFTATVAAKGISKDSDTWTGYPDAPEAVFEALAAQPKTLAEMTKRFGKAVN